MRRAPGGIVLRLVSPSGGARVRCFFTDQHAEALAGLGRRLEVAVTRVYVGLEGREVRVSIDGASPDAAIGAIRAA